MKDRGQQVLAMRAWAMSRSNRKGDMVWELMPRRKRMQSTVGRTGGRSRTQVRGGVRQGLWEECGGGVEPREYDAGL